MLLLAVALFLLFLGLFFYEQENEKKAIKGDTKEGTLMEYLQY